jgi:2-keto-4-pentenoate hydratase/2-oxohepta-3-ene-1,7-dioic acid hydratase in catechol pathway
MRQHDSTKLMLFQIGRQLSDISRVMTLEKGDIVLTGTPKGVGPVVTGDVMEAGLKVDGRDIEEARIKVEIQEREGLYNFAET